jgi:large subunit ribosomal protein L21
VYAIIEDGGKQYKVAQGEKVCVEIRDLDDDQTQIEFDRVLYLNDGQAPLVGQPILDGAKVMGTILDNVAGPKLFPMQFRRRKNSRRRIGHRQKYIEVEITEITKPS